MRLLRWSEMDSNFARTAAFRCGSLETATAPLGAWQPLETADRDEPAGECPGEQYGEVGRVEASAGRGGQEGVAQSVGEVFEREGFGGGVEHRRQLGGGEEHAGDEVERERDQRHDGLCGAAGADRASERIGEGAQ